MILKVSPEGRSQDAAFSRLPLRDRIYQVLRREIVNGQARPGQAIDELEIARRFGVSRTPVREAVKKLSDEGLINVVAQSGTYVSPINRGQVEEAFIIRTALELQSVSRAAPLVTERHVHDLEDIAAKLARAVDRRDFEDIVASDDAFHRYIAEINGLSMLWRAVDISKAYMDRCTYMTATVPTIGNQTIAEHKAIIAALKGRRQSEAVQAMRVHLDNGLRSALRVLDEPGDVQKGSNKKSKSRR
jgi:DNA-binding GntR family transcriptional regulator